MNTARFFKVIFFLLLPVFMISAYGESPEITSLKVEMQTNPKGLSTLSPRFSWQINADKPNLKQTSYRIQVSSSEKDLLKEKNLLWDSGQIESEVSQLIPYSGLKPGSGTQYFWRVRVGTNQGKSKWSKTGSWSTALLADSDWKARWIGEDTLSNPGETSSKNTRLAARYLRKTFTADKKVKRAVLYISGLGMYEAYINGRRISEDVFSPTPSWYPERVYYNTYDVTHLLKNGVNVLAVKLGNGRFFGMRENKTMMFGLPRLLAQLEMENTNHQKTTVITDQSWKITSRGPIVSNNEFDGEEYDARLEMKGWNSPEFDDAGWETAEIMKNPGGKLTAQPNPNIAVQDHITPLRIIKTTGNKYVLDMGQNMVGWLKVNLKGKKDKPLKMRFAEILKKDSTLYLDNIRSAKVTDIYTPATDGMFTWEPSFTYHGFRFVEIEGLDYEPSVTDFEGKVIYDRMTTSGSFETSSEMINTIYKNAFWGIRGNYRGMPTDCPQRDERMGWLGDRATGCFGEAFVFDNSQLYSKWIQDIEDSQSPEGSISVVSPRYWTIYNDDVTWPAAYFYAAQMLIRQFGDTKPIIKHYDSMKKYLEQIQRISMKDYIITKDTYGDWCMPPEKQELIHSKDPARKTDGAILSTTMYYQLLNMMCEFAEISSNNQDIESYKNLASKIKQAYNEKYFDKNTAQYGNNTVTANILSLRLGLVPAGYEQRVFENIVKKTETEFNGHVSTGVLGIQHLMRGLTEFGKSDLAFKIATNDTYPSWGYMAQKGATTIWELWNGDTADPSMNSGNHVMLLGDLLIWYYEDLAGIKNAPESNGYKKLLMQPVFPNNLHHVKTSYQSVYGEIKSEWTRKEGLFDWKITIPGNASAIVRIPKEITLNQLNTNEIISQLKHADYTEIEVGSGHYSFTGNY